MNEHLDTDSLQPMARGTLQYWITLLEDPTTLVEIYYWIDNVEILVTTPESTKAMLIME